MKSPKQATKRKVLVVLFNRLNRNQPSRYVELDCKPDGTIVQERPLKRQPTQAVYDEVWQNDEGKDVLKFCNRIKRIYRHPLEKRAQ